ncbi:MAG TPA: hypothetical protein VFE19_12230 [Jatrophihabitantaceae bacterium]|nr:hypothetical protein [Jatrophihabitantaceae bacterium]
MSISQGGQVPSSTCWIPSCFYVDISLSNFAAGARTITCSDSRDGTFYTFTATDTVIDNRCFVWHRNVQVWVTVNGVRSNTLDWNTDDDQHGHHHGGHGGRHHHGGGGHGHGGGGGGHHHGHY